MKLWLSMAMALVFFSGCTSRNEQIKLENQQKQLIRQQQLEIENLSKELENLKKPKKPKKEIEIKKVEDDNFDSAYMYPETKKTKKQVSSETKVQNTTATQTTAGMGKSECIDMIGQAKFDKYTQMFGNEAASIKRCKMLKASS